MNLIRFATLCLLAAISISAQASDNDSIPPGHLVIKDARIWSCKVITQAEIDELVEQRINTATWPTPLGRACLVRDERGRAAGLQVRQEEHGSMLLTYNEQTETYMRQTWVARPLSPNKIITDEKTFWVQLPQPRVSHEWETWKGSPDGPAAH